ncbi:MAG: TonB-dependent receptor [Hyphomonas sp.]|uniref:TonB-dependent receptor n=1 Tax=Hyphomonas sp. TaxID=87 RepID=UPI003001E08D
MRLVNLRQRRRVSLAACALMGAASLVTSANAQEAETDSEARFETVVVEGRRVSQTDLAIGQDEASNTVAVTREELLSAPAGISGLKMLESLPGFNVQTDGALGLYEFGNSVTVRAFNLQQIGFVLDGVPMGRSDAFGGSPIFRYVDNENLGSVVASPGAGDVSLPSYASLGPIVSYNTVAPSDEAGGILSYTLGDDDLQRTFVKLETGDINGFSAYISRSKTDSNLWRGPGTIDREHIEGKLRYEFDADTSIQATYVSNDFFDYDSPSSSRAGFEALGTDYGYSETLPAGCISPVSVDFNNDGVIDGSDYVPLQTGGNCTDYYQDRVNIRQDSLYALNFESDIVDGLNTKATLYYEDKDGFGVSPDGYSNTLSRYQDQVDIGLDVTHPRGVQYGLSGVGGTRKGAVLGFEWQVANHTVEIGGWYEKDEYNRTQKRLNNADGSADGAVLFDEVAYFRRDYVSVRDTMQYYIKDTISLMDDRLKLQAGLKLLDIDYSLDGYRDYDDYVRRDPNGGPVLAGYGPQSVSATYTSDALPNVGAVYDLNDSDQVFASFSKNYALPRGADDIFSTATSFVAPAPDAEESTNYEIGFRTNRPTFNGAAAIFYTSFDNRLVTGNVFNPATQQPESFSVNAGSTTAYGVELSGVWQPEIFDRKLYGDVNITYNNATNDDAFLGNPAGSLLADSPEWIFSGGITYEPTEWFVANLSTKYTGDRYADFREAAVSPGNMMEGYYLWSAYVDVGGPNNFGLPENVSLRVNVDNIFDEDTLAFTFTTTGGGNAFYRPLNPRTVQASLTVHF